MLVDKAVLAWQSGCVILGTMFKNNEIYLSKVIITHICCNEARMKTSCQPYSCLFLRYLNSANFTDIDRYVKLKCSKNNHKRKIAPNNLLFGKAIRENKIAKKLKIGIVTAEN